MDWRGYIERSLVRGLAYRVTRGLPWWLAVILLLVIFLLAGGHH